MKQRIWDILTAKNPDKSLSRIVNYGIIGLIFLNIVAFVLETVPELKDQYRGLFYNFEAFSVAIFTVEYILRVWSCTVENKSRIRFMFTPMALVDIVAILPFYLPFFGVDMRVARMLRLFRIFRVAKLGRYYNALKLIQRVFVKRKEELVMTSVIMFTLVLLSATFMYYAESDIQPEAFESIPKAMWWAVVTLTTVGYGDIAPVSAVGKIIAGLISTFGIGMFALPVGILGAGFVEEIESSKRENSADRCTSSTNNKDMQL